MKVITKKNHQTFFFSDKIGVYSGYKPLESKKMCAELLIAEYRSALDVMTFLAEKNVLHFEDKQLAQMYDLCEQTRNLIHFTKKNKGPDGNQMLSIEQERSIYDHLLKDFFQVMNDTIQKFDICGAR